MPRRASQRLSGGAPRAGWGGAVGGSPTEPSCSSESRLAAVRGKGARLRMRGWLHQRRSCGEASGSVAGAGLGPLAVVLVQAALLREHLARLGDVVGERARERVAQRLLDE